MERKPLSEKALLENIQSDQGGEGILRGVFQNFNPLCRRNPIENGS